MTNPLSQEAAKWTVMKLRLLATMPDLEGDEQALLDTLEGLTSVHERLAELVRSAMWDEASAAGMKQHMDRLTDRQSHLTARAEKKRKICHHYMEDLGLQRLNAPDMTVTRAATAQGVRITDVTKLPDEFVKIERTPKKKEIKAELLAKRDVPGAVLTNAGECLKVRI